MGVNLKDIIVKKEITFEDLAGKKIAVDAYNVLYQFLAAIRQRDGTPLKDSKGNITSHLAGLFYRTVSMMEFGIKPCFVFDGKPPDLKADTSARREKIKRAAEKKHREAIESKDYEAARKYAQQTSRLTASMISESRVLLEALGVPVIQSLGEGEAQAVYLANRGLVWGVASQDYDAILYGTPVLIRNLTVSSKKKVANKLAYTEVKPEIIVLADVLNKLNIELKQLIDLAILIGTDYNTGVKGIGPKTALKIIKEKNSIEYSQMVPRFDQIRNLFLKPAVTDNFSLIWKKPNATKLKKLLCDEREFSEARVDTALKRLEKKIEARKQTSLDNF